MPRRFRFLLAALICVNWLEIRATNSTDTASVEDPSVVTLEPLMVIGSRLADNLPMGAIVLEQADIDRSGATRLEELIAQLPQNYGGAGTGPGTVPNGSPSYGLATALFNFSGSTASPPQTGVAAAGLRGLGAGNTLVLIDGRRMPLATQGDTASGTGAGFYDLSSIPLGLIERVEILPDGASSIYGSDAVGGVINVVLKHGQSGGELTTSARGTSRGGGFERQATWSHGLIRGPLELLLAVTNYRREALRASQREFSARQNLTALGGFDYRLSLGSPPVIVAAVGNLTGLTLPGGGSTRIALVREGATGAAPALADFEPVAGFSALNQRRYNTAADKDLIGEMNQWGVNLSATWRLNPRLETFFQTAWSDRRSETANEPPAVLGGGFGGANSRVLASDPRNPFGQDVIVSLVLVEAPRRPQVVEVENLRSTFGVRGRAGEQWRWEASASHAREDFTSRTLELRTSLLIAALANGSFNPFGDPAVGPLNAAVSADLMNEAIVSGDSTLTTLDANTSGPLAHMPGGDLLLVAGADLSRASRDRTSTNPKFGQDAASETKRTTRGLYTEIAVPLVGEANAQPGLRKLSLKFAARAEHAGAYRNLTPSYGLGWSPTHDLRFGASYAGGFRAPALSEFENTLLSGTSTIKDPLQGGATYSVGRVRGSNPNIQAETSKTWRLSTNYRPSFLSGLQVHGAFTDTSLRDRLTTLTEQTLVNNEALFPGRIIRDSNGQITLVDATTVNFGRISARSLDLGLGYDRAFASGKLAVRADFVRQLDFRTELTPGTTAIVENGTDTGSPPRWTALGSCWWSTNTWEVGAIVHFSDGFASNTTGAFLDQTTRISSWTTVDLRASYRFSRGVWRGHGRNLRLQLGIGNIADRDPPFANLVWGYNAALHNPLGRTYDLSLRLPL